MTTMTPRQRPSTRRWACRTCGCTEARACPGGCAWVGYKLCSECASLDDLARARALGDAALWPVQPTGSRTLQQLADDFQVNKETLRSRLWNAGILLDETWQDGRQARGLYYAEKVAKARQLMDKEPVRGGRGRPVQAKRKGVK